MRLSIPTRDLSVSRQRFIRSARELHALPGARRIESGTLRSTIKTAYCAVMSRQKAVAHGATNVGRRGHHVLTPSIAQWTFMAILILLFGLSHTDGRVGAFLRAFSTFLFP